MRDEGGIKRKGGKKETFMQKENSRRYTLNC